MASFTKLERDSTAWKYRFGLVANVKDMRRNNQMFSCHYFVIREGLSSCYSGNSSSNRPAWYGLHVRLILERVVLRYFFCAPIPKKNMVYNFDCQLFLQSNLHHGATFQKVWFFLLGRTVLYDQLWTFKLKLADGSGAIIK